MTLFRGQQSKAAKGQGGGRGQGGELPSSTTRKTVPAGVQVDVMSCQDVNIQGRVVSGEQGLRGDFVFIYLCFVCFKQQQEAEEPCSQLAKKFRIRARKKIGKGEGEKRKKVAKNTGQ